VKLVLASPPSSSATTTVTTAVPTKLVVGVEVTVRFVPVPPKTTLCSKFEGLDIYVAVRVNLLASVSASFTVNFSGSVDAFSSMVTSAMGEIVGGLFVGFTVRTKDVDVVFPSVSRTVTVIVVVPV
jgi:hypothetical protein